MPLYEYKCQQCNSIIEKFYKISEKPKEIADECPNCKKMSTLEAIIGVPAISYMGVNHSTKVPSDLKNRFDQIRKHYPNMQSSI